MLALAPRVRSYPVLLPESLGRERQAAHRRPRRSPLVRAVAVVMLVVAPAVFYVWQSTRAARTGYSILSLQQEIAGLEADNARLTATVTALRAPDRIERIARTELGMAPPRQQQLAALALPPLAVAVQDVPRLSLWQRLGAWLRGGEAVAGESPR